MSTTAIDSAPVRLDVRGAVKRYGDFTALAGVDLSVRGGSVHALLGHNGAGKSTLIGLVSGATAPTAGTLIVDGIERNFSGPRDATAAGISVIHQHLSLVDSLTVSDNVFLGDERTGAGFLRRRWQAEETRKLLDQIGATCSPHDNVGSLPTAQRQLIEIAKALRADSGILILDEPTASLSDVESRRLGGLIAQLRSRGLAIVYVTHLLQEVERLADDVTVLEDGRVAHSGPASELDRADLVRLISGDKGTVSGANRSADAVTVSSASPLSTGHADARQDALVVTALRGPDFGPVDLRVARGEIVGLFGMLGSGRSELLETIAGARRATAGTVTLDDTNAVFRSPYAATRRGVSFVSGERARDGLLHGLSLAENLLVGCMGRLAKHGFRKSSAELSTLKEAKRQFDLTAPDNVLIGSLSGGNQQKVMLARAGSASARPRVLVLDGPSQGVDVGSRADIYQSLKRLASDHGTAILFSSSDPEEMRDLADRVLVFQRGAIIAELPIELATDSTLIRLASHGADPAPARLAKDVA
ncbi:sugar ABC transporter ATP-binding protein [Subtercola sp. YIM 133946]|uniref:sugar ABC transporter ATP-binding protein n=1 Tax=Subtercola sp. YIM 133946 TaxID=3118909 RepID=UPI002F93A0A5